MIAADADTPTLLRRFTTSAGTRQLETWAMEWRRSPKKRFTIR
jgi:hypothetical protein